MNSIADEIRSCFGITRQIEKYDDELYHYGTPRHSGRYPYGSGENPYQRTGDFLSRVEELKKQGWKETAENIQKEFGMNTSQYRYEKTICNDARKLDDIRRAKSLKADGYNNSEIGRIMGKNESSIREYLKEDAEAKRLITRNTVEALQKRVDESRYGMVDVGKGTDLELRISKDRLDLALYYLEKEGYGVYGGGIPQPTNPGQQTIQRVLCKPGTKYSDIYDYDKIDSLTEYVSQDGGETLQKKFVYPKSMDSSRLMIRYADDAGPDGITGNDKDGTIEIRRGVADLSLGESKYAQVRIMVDNDRYLKGMAVYSDNMPDGVDVVFNTNKSSDKSMRDVLKKIKSDPDNPFGALIKEEGGQSYYIDKDGKKQLSLINKTREEGDWTEWKDALPSQFLAKQNMSLIKKQLKLAKDDKMDEFNEINSITLPTLKKHLLNKFADECDAAAVDLKAAALPGQKYHVILPINSLKDTEVFAPQYKDGTQLALIRYPHGGTFEIPILTVNNKNASGKSTIGLESIDAIGINKKNADRLSGADFDGDTVMCIPTNNGRVKITSTRALKDLEGFDPKLAYGASEVKTDANGTEHAYRNGREFKIMRNTQTQMGIASNLITDMTLAGAPESELARAVKHSMVVIDAEKHKLDYKASEIDNGIAALKKKWQLKYDDEGNAIGSGGAATIFSRSKGQRTVDKRQGSPIVNLKGSKDYDPSKPEGSLIYKTADDLYYPVRQYDKTTKLTTITTTNGKKITYNSKNKAEAEEYEPVKRVDAKTGEVTYTNKEGTLTYKTKKRTQKSTRMGETDDAYTLVSASKNAKELEYADYANYMKNLANTARIAAANTGKVEKSDSARKVYASEYESLMKKLNDAELNAPKERAATRLAAAEVKDKESTGEYSKKDLTKAGTQAVTKYRTKVGSVSRKDRNIDITDNEWKAIQNGAFSDSQLKRILNNTDIATLRQRATPRSTTKLSNAKIAKIKSMKASGCYTLSEIARAAGVSTSTVSDYLKGAN